MGRFEHTERIWFEAPFEFITASNYDRFLPSAAMTKVQQMNCVLRFSIYFAGVCIVMVRNVNILIVPLVAALITYHLVIADRRNDDSEQLLLEGMQAELDMRSREPCRLPTKENPFMNVLISDYATDPARPKACSMDSPRIARDADTLAGATLYTDVDDVSLRGVLNDRNRPFYTTSSTTIPNDQNGFASWCYRPSGRTCKEGNYDRCLNEVLKT